MVYKKINMFVEPTKPFDLKVTVSIFNSFLNNLKEYNLGKANFNHYSQNRITVRFDFEKSEVETKAIEIANNLVQDNKIIKYDPPEEANPPEYVTVAHMLASQCAVELSKHNEFFEEKQNRPLQFFMYFLKLLFERLGYPFYCTWDLVRKYKENIQLHEKVEELAKHCENFFSLYKTYFENPDFIERFIHLLMNCTLMQSILFKAHTCYLQQADGVKEMHIYDDFETKFWSQLANASALKKISEDCKKINQSN